MNLRPRRLTSLWIAFAALLFVAAGKGTNAQDEIPTPTHDELPLAEWISAGEREDFDWDITIDTPRLQLDQHYEIAVTAELEAGDLDAGTEDHQLSLVTVVTDREGLWLGVSEPVRETLPANLHEDTGVEFETYISLTPGRYVVWAILYDETTGQRNVARERREVDDIGNDPLPDAYADFPRVEFAVVEHRAGLTIRQFGGDLSIPIPGERPIEIELLATISGPEQWPGGSAVTRHIENLYRGLRVLSQMDPAVGSISITGLDLLRRNIVFEHTGDDPVDWTALLDTFDSVNRSAVSVEALLGRRENPAYLREYVHDRVSTFAVDRNEPPGGDDPLRVLIVVAGIMRFDRDADKRAIPFEGDCDCNIYHVRFKQDRSDLFDQIDDFLEPFDPPTYDVVSARDLRKAIGEIVEDLSGAAQ